MEKETTVQKFLNSPISFFTSIVIAVFAFAGMYFGITNKIELMAQKIEYHIGQTADIPGRTSMLETAVAVLQAKQSRP